MLKMKLKAYQDNLQNIINERTHQLSQEVEHREGCRNRSKSTLPHRAQIAQGSSIDDKPSAWNLPERLCMNSKLH
jgi:hypothetical protein